MKVLPIQSLSKIEKYWFGNNPSLTHFMSALSVLFPEGERYFMKTMNAYRSELSVETLEELNIFCRQESHLMILRSLKILKNFIRYLLFYFIYKKKGCESVSSQPIKLTVSI